MQGIELTPSEVASVINGFKTQKRVPIIPNKHLEYTDEFWERIKLKKDVSLCPYGKVGATLHKCGSSSDKEFCFCYYDKEPKEYDNIKLKITEIRIERLQDISSTDVYHEGIEQSIVSDETMREAFNRFLWEPLYKDTLYDWASNPWVWVIGFEVSDGDSNA